MESNTKWSPILYQKQSCPDNYTDAAFYQQYIRSSISPCPFTYIELCIGSLNIAQAFNILASFLFFYNMLLSNSINDGMKAIFILLCGGLYLLFYLKSNFVKLGLKNIMDGMQIMAFLYFFTPLLHKLSMYISTDTTILIICSILLISTNYVLFSIL